MTDMHIEAKTTDDIDPDEWNRYVDRSPQSTPFHRYESLTTIAAHADATLRALVGYDGQEPVGVFPVFTGVTRFVSTVFSPPYDLGVSYLGPALLDLDQLKRRKRDERHRRFIDACVEWIDTNERASYLHVRTSAGYDDVRALQWNGFEITPAHTYYVDLACDREDLLASFSRDARSNIRKRDEYALTIDRGGSDAVKHVIDRVRERHEDLEIPYRMSRDFAVDLYEALPDGWFHPYEALVDGERIGGMLVLDDGNTAYRWQGGSKANAGVPVNDVLDWHVMEQAKARGVEKYDLVSADSPRISRYKAKFNPQLKLYFRAERGGVLMKLAASVYRSVKS